MRLVMPNQTVLSSYYTAEEMVLSPAPGRFVGSHSISDIGAGGEDPRPQMESFLAKLQGRMNLMSLPVHRDPRGSLDAGDALSVSAAEIVGGVLSATVAGAEEGGLLDGDIVSIGNRCYILVADMTATRLSLLPAVVPVVGTAIVWEDARVVARLTEQSAEQVASHRPDYSGPWELEWTEAV